MSDTEIKRSKQESIKDESKFLKGNVAAELADASTEDVSDDVYELLKFHGSYFGHNRDTATERKKKGLDKEYEFMLRSRIPGGRMTAEQYLALDELASKYANGTLRITTRQVIQFHVILKKNLKPIIKEINDVMLSTQSACGDVVRNVTTSAAPIKDAKYERMREDVEKVASFVVPKSSAYREIFLDEHADEIRERGIEGQELTDGEEYEPLYGKFYLPRKFKIGLALPEDNSIDVFTHDLGFVLIFEGDEFKGYNMVVGGGMGMSHEPAKEWKDKKTYPRIANTIAFIQPDDLLNAVEAVVKLQRDHGDRSDRKHARLKYLVEEKGVEWTTQTFKEYFANTNPTGDVSEPVKIENYEIPTWMGWHEQGDGKWFLGVPVASGRIHDYVGEHPTGYNAGNNEHFKGAKYRSGLKAVIERFKMPVVLTPTEEIILADISPEDKNEIEEILRSFDIPLAEEHTFMQLHFMTCVALPTCAKALAEAERVQFPIMDDIQAVMDKYEIGNERITVRVTGCPNGCARPYVGDIGIVGRMPGHYVLFIGGDFEGTRLNTKVFDKVPQDDIGKALDPMFAKYAAEKNDDEGFGDFCHRVGIETMQQVAIDALAEEELKWATAA